MKRLFVLVTILSSSFFMYSVSQAQETVRNDPVTVACGDIVEGELVSNFEEQSYIININAGTQLDIRAEPLGGGLSLGIILTGPTNFPISASSASALRSNWVWQTLSSRPTIQTDVLSASGSHRIRIINFAGYDPESDRYSPIEPGGIGVYTLYIGCTLRDGTVIRPGDTIDTDTAPDEEENITAVTTVAEPVFGFPGLAPVDFSNGVTVPLQADVPNTGSISPGFEGIFGYSFSGSANETVTLEFERQSGNLNLGLVVLSADNQVAFQASLINFNSLTTEFALPADGDYTIGVFRVDLLPVDAPEATSFSVSFG